MYYNHSLHLLQIVWLNSNWEERARIRIYKHSAMSSETAARSPLPGGPIRLSNVQGYEQRMNDVIYCPPLEKYTDENLAVVYFGGDIQVRPFI